MYIAYLYVVFYPKRMCLLCIYYAVVGDIAIRFLSNLAQKSIVSYPELTYIFISYSLFPLFKLSFYMQF